MIYVYDSRVCVSDNVEKEIVSFFSQKRYECGGVLCSSREGYVEFFFSDRSRVVHGDIYYPNASYLNDLIGNLPAGMYVCGMIHSHSHNRDLSAADKSFCEKILKINGISSFIMGLYIQTTGEIRFFDCILEDDKA